MYVYKNIHCGYNYVPIYILTLPTLQHRQKKTTRPQTIPIFIVKGNTHILVVACLAQSIFRQYVPIVG